MTILDWVAIISLSIAILLLFFMLVNLVLFFKAQKELKGIARIKTRNKKKRKRLFRKKKELRLKKRKQLISIVLYLLLAIAGIAASGYTVYYQSTNLGKEDQKNIVMGYYYLSEVEQQINDFEAGKLKADELETNLGTISMRLSAFTAKADYRINSKGQLVINRYYTATKELGKVAFAKQGQIATDPALLVDFKTDVAKVREKEQKVLDMFKISENSLKQK